MDSAPRTYTLALLPGDGIGPEVTAEAARVLDAAADAHGFAIQTSERNGRKRKTTLTTDDRADS